MTSIYSIISTELRLLTHFSGYKVITLHFTKKQCYMFYTDSFAFSLIDILQNFVEVFILHFGYSHILNKLETIFYSLCFKKQTLEILLDLSFKAELPKDGL